MTTAAPTTPVPVQIATPDVTNRAKGLFTPCDCDFLSQQMGCIGFNVGVFTWCDCENDTKLQTTY